MAANSQTDGEGTGLLTDSRRLTDTDTDRQADWLTQADTGRQKDKDNWAQKERKLKVECRLTLDKNPHRSTPLIGVLSPSVTPINLKESDSLSF